MTRHRFPAVTLVLAALVTALMAAGCDDKSSSSGNGSAATPASARNVLGTYENAADKLTVVLKPDNKATLIDEGKSTEHTWEMDGADKVIVHGMDGVKLGFTINSDGHLSDGMGGVYRKK